jgi:hypothetical protein
VNSTSIIYPGSVFVVDASVASFVFIIALNPVLGTSGA